MTPKLDWQHSTYDEIIRQQNGWKTAIESLEKDIEIHRKWLEMYRKRIWVFTGCGTSYYLAQMASWIFSKLTGVQCKAVPASEILIFPELVFSSGQDHLLVPMSRSGATTELKLACQNARSQFNVPTLAVSCDSKSIISKESDHSLSFPFKKEESVVMTGSFTTLLFSIVYLALIASRQKDAMAMMHSVIETGNGIMHEFEPLMKDIGQNLHLSDFIFLGQGPFYGLANEAALKIQEMTISNSQSYHTLEYRHGPKSTATDRTLVTFLCSQAEGHYSVQLAKELAELGINILVMHTRGMAFTKIAKYTIELDSKFDDFFNVFFYAPLIQLLGYYRAVAKNINPDSPRHLSAVVTFDIEEL